MFPALASCTGRCCTPYCLLLHLKFTFSSCRQGFEMQMVSVAHQEVYHPINSETKNQSV